MNATTIEVMSLGKDLRSEGSMSEKEGIEPASRVNNDKEEAVPPPSFSPLPAMDQKLPVSDVGTPPVETLQAAPSAEAAQSLPVNKSVAPFGVPLKCRSAKPCSLDPLRLSDISTCVQELNKRYAVVKWGGKVLVIDELDDTVQPLKPTDFFNLYNNIRVQGTGNTTSPLGSYWFNSPSRRQYLDGVVFDPSGSHPRGVYNLWQGFGVHPMSGASCVLFHAHLLQVICAGCVKCYQYVLNWLALMIQQPHELPGVAIVLVSIEGTGKGLFIKYLQALMGVHFVRVSHKSELVGQFSGHLSRAVLVFADELCWRDDRDAAGVLKGLITEKTRLLNQKHIDAIPMNNCIHLIAASNESWVIPAGQTDRRFLVLDVVPSKVGDTAYFKSFADEIDNGGPEALLAELSCRDIRGFVPSQFPKTTARLRQQLRSLDVVHLWIFEMLQVGSLPCLESGPPGIWPSKYPKQRMFEIYRNWVRQHHHHGSPSCTLADLTLALKKYGVSTGKMPSAGNFSRQQAYNLPSLTTMREAFTAHLGYPGFDWQDFS